MYISRLLLLFLCLAAMPVRAEVLILVHGWASDADTWLYSGVVAQLEQGGWQDAGAVLSTPDGVMIQRSLPPSRGKWLYRASLPAQAPLMVQASLLHQQLSYLRSIHQSEKLTVAAHSAGGIVSRMALVRPDAVQVDSLVTIAAPHLGSHRAIEGLEVVDAKPFFCPGPGINLLKSVVGGDDYRYVRDSRAVLHDLLPAAYGNLLDHLNRQTHPAIEYHSIIKQIPGSHGDGVVPAFSQDMNQVFALRGRASTHLLQSPHALGPMDGQMLLTILGDKA